MVYEKVVEYCKNQKISIASLEESCGIANGTIGKWKDNVSEPSLKTLKRLEEYTKLPVVYWLN